MEKLKVGDWYINPSENSIRTGNNTVFIEPKAMALLMLLVKASGETLRREYIIESIWERTFVNDSALNNLVSSLRRYLNTDKEEAYIRTRPKLGYQLIAKVEHLATKDDVTTDFSQSAQSVASAPNIEGDQTHPVPMRHNRKVWGLSLAFCGLFLFVLAWAYVSREDAFLQELPLQIDSSKDTPQVVNTYSIAILPFVFLEPGGSYDFFAEGLASELIHQLNVVPNFKVISRRSSFKFKGELSDTVEIANTLKVDYLLEGTVREVDEVLRITLQLVQASDGGVIWSKVFSAGQHNNFAVQHQISNEIATTLDASFTQIPDNKMRYQANSSEAYLHVLRGRRLNQVGTAEAHLQARDEFKMATLLEPEYAEAHVDLAISYLLLHQQKRLDYDESQTLALESINKALEIDPELAEAHSAIGMLFTNKFDFTQAKDAFEKALSINPNLYIANVNYANLLRMFYHTEKAAIFYKRALELAPLSSAANWGVSSTLLGLGYLDDAIMQAKTCSLRAPQSASCLYMLAYAARMANNHQLADDTLEKVKSLVEKADYTFQSVSAWHALWQNKLSQADAIFAQHIEQYGFNLSGLQTLSYVQLGLNNQAQLWQRLQTVTKPKTQGISLRTNYAHAAFFNGECKKAVEFYEHVLDEQPSLMDNRDIQANGVSYAANLAHCYQVLGNTAKSEQMLLRLNEAIASFPENDQAVPGILFLRVQYHVLRNEIEQARYWAKQLKATQWGLLWLLEKDPICRQVTFHS